MHYWGGQRVCWPPLSNYLGGLAPPGPPSSYAYVQDDISTLSINFTNQLMKICEITIPKSKSGPKKKLHPPWWNQTCTNAIRTREKARKNTWVTRPKKIRISRINLRLMLEKRSKLPKKNVGNHLSQNSHINQQVRKYGT